MNQYKRFYKRFNKLSKHMSRNLFKNELFILFFKFILFKQFRQNINNLDIKFHKMFIKIRKF